MDGTLTLAVYGAVVSTVALLWNIVRDIAQRRCRRCKLQIQDPNELTVDHIKPRSKYPGLALVLSNLQVLCRRCNSSKGVG
jgi:5-methylcytosine-specific restriction endonuclease McrA